MIVWINGSHGVGKTTTAALVQQLIPDSRVLDAEKVGETLLDISPGLHASGELVRLARHRNETRATFHIHDLAEPMTWAASKSFDRVVMALVLHHLVTQSQHSESCTASWSTTGTSFCPRSTQPLTG